MKTNVSIIFILMCWGSTVATAGEIEVGKMAIKWLQFYPAFDSEMTLQEGQVKQFTFDVEFSAENNQPFALVLQQIVTPATGLQILPDLNEHVLVSDAKGHINTPFKQTMTATHFGSYQVDYIATVIETGEIQKKRLNIYVAPIKPKFGAYLVIPMGVRLPDSLVDVPLYVTIVGNRTATLQEVTVFSEKTGHSWRLKRKSNDLFCGPVKIHTLKQDKCLPLRVRVKFKQGNFQREVTMDNGSEGLLCSFTPDSPRIKYRHNRNFTNPCNQ